MTVVTWASVATTALLVGGVALVARMHLHLRSRALEIERRRELERFVPQRAVERVLAGDVPSAVAERRVVTVVFADLRGSSLMAERLPANEFVTVMKDFTAIGETVNVASRLERAEQGDERR